MIAVLIAALVIAHPRLGTPLPPVDRCYMIGATDRAVTNVLVKGVSVPVYRTGAWVTTVDVVPGVTNVVPVVAGDEATVVRFFVAPRPRPRPGVTNVAPEKVYTKLAYAGDFPSVQPPGKTPAETVVWIDPGHGGPTDFGAWSPHCRKEKDANLLLAEDFAAALTNRGYRVKLTRTTDAALALMERARRAHEEKADAFISIHHNAPAADGDVASVRYRSVYSWNPLGESLARALAGRTEARVLHANFAVTRSPEIPSVLVEADFITHPEGEEAAFDAASRRALAEDMAEGFAAWCVNR